MIQRPLPCFSQFTCYCNLPSILEFQPAVTKLHQLQACEHEKRTNTHKCVNAQGSILSKRVGICGWKGEYQHDISSWREDRLAVDDGNPLTVLLLMLSATNQPWSFSSGLMLWFFSFSRLAVSCPTTFLWLFPQGVEYCRDTALVGKRQWRKEQRVSTWVTLASTEDVIYWDTFLFHQSGGRKADPSKAGKHFEKSW